MQAARSLLFNLLFYPATFLWAIAGVTASLFGRGPIFAVVMSWVAVHHWLARHLLGIRTTFLGSIAPGPHLIAVKHQSMFETIEMLRLARLPVIVMKQELARLPAFGAVTRCYGVITVERSAGAKALRNLVKAGQQAISDGRPVMIFPEGTRVLPGETPPLQAGFAGLYRALGLPVVPVAVDSGRLWGRGLAKRSGMITFKVGEPIPPGLPRGEIEQRVHAAINALELPAQSPA